MSLLVLEIHLLQTSLISQQSRFLIRPNHGLQQAHSLDFRALMHPLEVKSDKETITTSALSSRIPKVCPSLYSQYRLTDMDQFQLISNSSRGITTYKAASEYTDRINTNSVHLAAAINPVNPRNCEAVVEAHQGITITLAGERISANLHHETQYASSLIDNVAAAAHFHKNDRYLSALRLCCVHNLHNQTCKIAECPGRHVLLCEEFRAGNCPSPYFSHGIKFHTIKFCIAATETGKCYAVGCLYGHDNMEVRLLRLTERRNDMVMNILAQQQMANEWTDRQLAKI